MSSNEYQIIMFTKQRKVDTLLTNKCDDVNYWWAFEFSWKLQKINLTFTLIHVNLSWRCNRLTEFSDFTDYLSFFFRSFFSTIIRLWTHCAYNEWHALAREMFPWNDHEGKRKKINRYEYKIEMWNLMGMIYKSSSEKLIIIKVI